MNSTMDDLSRRERQIMGAIYRLAGATVSEVLDEMAEPPSYSAVRTQLGILEGKGFLEHRQEGRRYVYPPTEPMGRARKKALHGVLRTFFDGSPRAAIAALLDNEDARLSDEDLEELADLVEAARATKGV